jgi:predicted nucleic acid-binding protein
VIVVDTNLLAYLYIQGQRTAEAEAVLRRDPEWAAPLLWRSEFRSVLAGLVRRRALPLHDAVRLAEEAEVRMAGREYTVPSHAVLQLAAESGCSAYDCEFASLARDLGTVLVTVDHALLSAFPTMAVSPRVFTARTDRD